MSNRNDHDPYDHDDDLASNDGDYSQNNNDKSNAEEMDSFDIQPLHGLQMHLAEVIQTERNKRTERNKKEMYKSRNDGKGEKGQKYREAPTSEEDEEDDEDEEEEEEGQLSDGVQARDFPGPWSELIDFDPLSTDLNADDYGQNISMTPDAYEKWRKDKQRKDKQDNPTLHWPDLDQTNTLINACNDSSITHVSLAAHETTPYFVYLIPEDERNYETNHGLNPRNKIYQNTVKQMDEYIALQYPARLLMWRNRSKKQALLNEHYTYEQWSETDKNGRYEPKWITKPIKKLPQQWVIEQEVRIVKQPPYLSTASQNMAIWLWETDEYDIEEKPILCSVEINEDEISFSQINDVNVTKEILLDLIPLTSFTRWTFPVIERLFEAGSPIQIFVDANSRNPTKRQLGIKEDQWVNAQIGNFQDTALEDTHWIVLDFPHNKPVNPDQTSDSNEDSNKKSDKDSDEDSDGDFDEDSDGDFDDESQSDDKVIDIPYFRINLYYFHVRPYITSASNSDDSEDNGDSDTDSDEERKNTNVYDDDSDFVDNEVVEYDSEHGSGDELLPYNDGRLMGNCQSVNNAFGDATAILPLFRGRVNDQTYTQLQDSDLLFSFTQLLEMRTYTGSDLLRYAVKESQIVTLIEILQGLKKKVRKITNSTIKKIKKEKLERARKRDRGEDVTSSDEESEYDIGVSGDMEESGEESEDSEVSVVPAPKQQDVDIYNKTDGKVKTKTKTFYSLITSKFCLLQAAYTRAKSRGTLIDGTTRNKGNTLIWKRMKEYNKNQQDAARKIAMATAKTNSTKFLKNRWNTEYQNIMDKMLNYENEWRSTFRKVLLQQISPHMLINDSIAYNLWEFASDDDLIDSEDDLIDSTAPEAYTTHKQILAFIASNLMYWREVLIGKVFDKQNTETVQDYPELAVDTSFEDNRRARILRDWKVTLQSVASDGNCGSHSFIASMGLEIDVYTLRERSIQQITTWLTSQSRTELFASLQIFKYIGLVTLEDTDFDSMFATQLTTIQKRMRIGQNKHFIKSSNWATLEDMEVLGFIYKVNIRVLREMGNKMKWINVYNCDCDHSKTIYLFHSGQHFQWLKPTEENMGDPAPDFNATDFYEFYQLKKRVPKQNIDKLVNRCAGADSGSSSSSSSSDEISPLQAPPVRSRQRLAATDNESPRPRKKRLCFTEPDSSA